jgi:di/tricarboxylate transporter
LLPWIKKDISAVESQKHLQSVLKEQYQELGSPSWEEYSIAILFVVMVGLWVTRDFSSSPGWEIIFQKE